MHHDEFVPEEAKPGAKDRSLFESVSRVLNFEQPKKADASRVLLWSLCRREAKIWSYIDESTPKHCFGMLVLIRPPSTSANATLAALAPYSYTSPSSDILAEYLTKVPVEILPLSPL